MEAHLRIGPRDCSAWNAFRDQSSTCAEMRQGAPKGTRGHLPPEPGRDAIAAGPFDPNAHGIPSLRLPLAAHRLVLSSISGRAEASFLTAIAMGRGSAFFRGLDQGRDQGR